MRQYRQTVDEFQSRKGFCLEGVNPFNPVNDKRKDKTFSTNIDSVEKEQTTERKMPVNDAKFKDACRHYHCVLNGLTPPGQPNLTSVNHISLEKSSGQPKPLQTAFEHSRLGSPRKQAQGQHSDLEENLRGCYNRFLTDM